MYIKYFFSQKLLFIRLFVKFCNMKEILRENKYLLILWILCIFGLIFFCGHYSGILIDFGREVYYPEQILEGKILYKDLFNIYGPLSYQINAVLYKIFGAKLLTLYASGCICSILTVSSIYLIAKRFLSEFLSFCAGLFTIAAGVCAVSIFNFHFPYSWALLYGLNTFLFSLYFLLKYEGEKKSSFLCASAFLAGISTTCKYDFLLYSFIVLFFILKAKDLKAFLCFIFAPVFSFGSLFIQGMRIEDLINQIVITAAMAKSKTLTYFYQNSGIYFHPKALLTDFIIFLKTAVPFVGILFGVSRNKKIVTVISWILFLLLLDTKTMFGFLPLFLLVFACAGYKKISSSLAVLIISALAVCAKVFWVMLLGSYGNYYVSIALVAFFALLFKLLPQKLEKTAGIYLIAVSVILMCQNFHLRTFANEKIQTPKGTIYTVKKLSESTNKLIEFLNSTNEKDNVVIFPEGMTVNFLSERKSDDFYNSLLPLYIETFGEDKIVNHYKKTKPEYIIFNNLNMKDYYFNYICQDYALSFCGFVQENYNPVTVIDEGFRYIIFKHK